MGNKIIFFTTSNRWEGEKELPKSSMLAKDLRDKFEIVIFTAATKDVIVILNPQVRWQYT